jgi:hypothetical protein
MLRERIRGFVLFLMVAVFSFGIMLFWDGPIHPCQNSLGYCGKGGRPHSAFTYHLYEKWETTMLIVWPSGMLALFATRPPKRKR